MNYLEALAYWKSATNYGFGHHIYDIPQDDLETSFLVTKTDQLWLIVSDLADSGTTRSSFISPTARSP
jgi:hypothetical protein